MSSLSRLIRRMPLVRDLFGGGKRRRQRSTGHRDVPGVLVKGGHSLSADGLLRTFGSGDARTYALQDVSLGLHAGQLNLLMGPSGSGKSTLLAVMSALLRPDRGSVKALGYDLWRMSELELEKFRLKHCSYIFQGYNLFPALTARQQLEVVLKWGEGATTSEARRRSEKILNQLGLGSRMNLRPQQLSGGEKQRVAIARALVKRPSFIFADEPTSALDWENGQQVIELLNETARKGTTVLVVTHDPRLLGYAHQVFELADGKLMHGGAPANPAAINAHGHGATPALGHRHGSMAATHSCPTCRAATPYSPRVMLKDYYGQFANC